jgi:hypothetical protein
MKKIIVITLISLFIISPNTKVEAELEPIYPLQSQIIGAKYSHEFSLGRPYLSSGYDFNQQQLYYQLGSQFNYNQHWNYGLKYSHWANYSLPGYLYQQGFNGSMNYQQSEQELTRNLQISLFHGHLGENLGQEIKTNYINLNYNQQLYQDWNNKANFILDITSGQGRENYYSSNLKIPIKFNNFTLIPQLGYINQGDQITPYYDLANYVTGYNNYNPQQNKGEQGTKLLAIKLEKSFNLLPYTDLPLLNLLQGVTSITAADVLEDNEELNDFNLHSSASLGLALNLVEVDLRLERVVTDKGNWKILFTTNYIY